MKHQDYFLLKALTGWQDVELNEVPVASAPEGSLQSLEEVLQHLDDIDTVTLDIFDTLLRRDVEPPDYPKRAAMQALSYLLAQAGVSLSVDELLDLRQEAESLARQAALTHGGDAECTLSEIFSQLYELIEVRYSIKLDALLPVQELGEFEVQVETERLSPMPGAHTLLQSLKQAGKRVILLSDMYLEPQHIQQILNYHGLQDYIDKLYVSSDTRRSKGSGSLFAHLIAEGELNPEQTLHLGDHPISDFQRPQEHGLHARLFHCPPEKQRRTTLEQALRLNNRFGDSSHLWHLSDSKQPETASPYQVGYQRLGPIFTLFALDIFFKALSGSYREVFFLARDGYLLQQLYTRLRERLTISRMLPSPAGRYLYLSRASTRLATLSGRHDELVSLAQRVNRQDGVWALIAILGLDRQSYEPLINDLLRSNTAADDLDQSAELQHQLLNNPQFMEQLQADIRASNQRLQDYLTQEGLLGEGKVLLVDIGWNGSILATLEQAFGHLPTFPHIDACFFGRLYGETLKKINLLPGFAYDAKRNNPIEHLINECRELFETVASSQEGSVLGYISSANGISPRCAESTLSENDNALISQIQQGILDYCDEFTRMYNRFAPAPEALHYDALLQATSLIAGTYPQEQEILADLKFDLSWGTESRVNLREYLGITTNIAHTPPPHTQAPLQISLSDESGMAHDIQKLFEQIHQMIERLRQEESLIFYGVGTVASLVAPHLLNKIAYFVDGNSALQGQRFLDRPIHTPDVLFHESGHSVFVTPIRRKAVIHKRLAGCPLPLYFIDDLL